MKLLGKVLVFSGILFMSCSSFLGEKPLKGALKGMVYDQTKAPVSGLTISLFQKDQKEPTAKTQTDINGRFNLNEIPFGVVRLTLNKELFEETTINIQFLEETQVIYSQVVNRDQLVKMGFDALETREWAKAKDFLDRALVLDPAYVETQFLKAYVLISKKEIPSAINLLEELVNKMNSPYPIHILLADLYQETGIDSQKEAYHLEEALRLKFDPQWQKRLDKIKSMASGK